MSSADKCIVANVSTSDGFLLAPDIIEYPAKVDASGVSYVDDSLCTTTNFRLDTQTKHGNAVRTLKDHPDQDRCKGYEQEIRMHLGASPQPRDERKFHFLPLFSVVALFVGK